MSELVSPVKLEAKVKRKYVKTGTHSKKYKAFRAKGKKAKVVEPQESKPVVNNYVDTSLPKYHSFEEHSTFKRCNGCGSVLRLEVTGCQYCVRKDRTS